MQISSSRRFAGKGNTPSVILIVQYNGGVMAITQTTKFPNGTHMITSWRGTKHDFEASQCKLPRDRHEKNRVAFGLHHVNVRFVRRDGIVESNRTLGLRYISLPTDDYDKIRRS